jgi:hypothetical protein
VVAHEDYFYAYGGSTEHPHGQLISTPVQTYHCKAYPEDKNGCTVFLAEMRGVFVNALSAVIFLAVALCHSQSEIVLNTWDIRGLPERELTAET